MPTPAPIPAPNGAPGSRVAIVCRLGEAEREAASAFVTQLGLEPLSIGDPSNDADGKFIDRLDGLRDLDYAIVMLPADEPGGLRPGLLLALGFLLGAAGPGRVCFVVSGKAQLAPELDGIARHSLDEGGLWRLLLAREMKQAGLDVDMNRAL